jgi:hypothetical protein
VFLEVEQEDGVNLQLIQVTQDQEVLDLLTKDNLVVVVETEEQLHKMVQYQVGEEQEEILTFALELQLLQEPEQQVG